MQAGEANGRIDAMMRPGFISGGFRSRSRSAIALAFAAAVLAAGCTESSSTVTTNPDAVSTSKCQVSLSTPSGVGAEGGTGSVAVTTQPECAWTASATVNWISALSPASGQGNGNVAFQVSANDTAGAREGDVVINDVRAHVSQRAPCRYTVAPANQTIDSGGGAGSVTVTTTSDCAWSASADANWIAFTSTASGAGNGTVAFSVAANTGGERVASISIGGQRSTITQAAVAAPPSNCTYTISPTSQNIGAAGGPGTTVTVTAQSTCLWTAVSNVPWITVGTGASGAGNGSVTFTVAANTGASRTGTLTIAGRAFTVTQAAAGAPCSYSISPSSQNVGAGGGTGNVNVTAGSACAWTATSNVSWIGITAGASGTGNGTVSYAVLPNTGGARSGTLTIAGQTFIVNQAALSCSFSVAPNNFDFNAPGGTGTVAVTTSSGCAWTATSNDAWITVTSGASGTGNGAVTFSVAPNTGRDRKGNLTVAGRNVSVDQKGP